MKTVKLAIERLRMEPLRMERPRGERPGMERLRGELKLLIERPRGERLGIERLREGRDWHGNRESKCLLEAKISGEAGNEGAERGSGKAMNGDPERGDREKLLPGTIITGNWAI